MARGRKKQYHKEDVLTKAMEVFWRKGYEGAHLKELVEYTGLNRFSLYSEFDGKEGLFCEALAHYLKMAREIYLTQLGQTPRHIDNIYGYFDSIQFGDDYHGCMMVNTLNNQHAVPKAAFEMATDFTKWVRNLYLENLKSAVRQGIILEQSPIENWCDLLLSFDLGLAISGIPIKTLNSGVLARQCLDALLQAQHLKKLPLEEKVEVKIENKDD
ncbi:MAG: TetR/AcrR family transcriptional regulator [Bermanella sp.]